MAEEDPVARRDDGPLTVGESHHRARATYNLQSEAIRSINMGFWGEGPISPMRDAT